MTDTLTAKQALFVEEYLVDLNATQAAIRAGYSEKTADVIGCENLGKPNIQSAIQGAMAARSERTNITQDRVLQELARLGFSDLRKTMTEGGALLDPQDWDDDTAASISAIEVVTTYTGETDEDGRKVPEYTRKIKTWDKNAALEKLAKHLGMYAPEKREHTSPDGSMTPQSPVALYELPSNGRDEAT